MTALHRRHRASVHYLSGTDTEPEMGGRSTMGINNSVHAVGLVVHIDDTLGEQRRQDIELAMRQERGVVEAHFAERRPHLMVVEYDPDEISSTDILRDIHRQSVHAELIGPV